MASPMAAGKADRRRAAQRAARVGQVARADRDRVPAGHRRHRHNKRVTAVDEVTEVAAVIRAGLEATKAETRPG